MCALMMFLIILADQISSAFDYNPGVLYKESIPKTKYLAIVIHGTLAFAPQRDKVRVQ